MATSKTSSCAVIDLLESVTKHTRDFGPKERVYRITGDDIWDKLKDSYDTRRCASGVAYRKTSPRQITEALPLRVGHSASGTRRRSKSLEQSTFDSHFKQGNFFGSIDRSELSSAGLSTSFVRPKLMKSNVKNFCGTPDSAEQPSPRNDQKIYINISNACPPPPSHKILQRRSRSFNDFKSIGEYLPREEIGEPLTLVSGTHVYKIPNAPSSARSHRIKSDSDVDAIKVSRIAYPAADFPDLRKQKDISTESNYQKLLNNLKASNSKKGRQKYDLSFTTTGRYDNIDFCPRHYFSDEDSQLPRLPPTSAVVTAPEQDKSDPNSNHPKGIISLKPKSGKSKKRVTLFIPDEDIVFVPDNSPRDTPETKLPEVDQSVGKSSYIDRLNDSGIETELENCAEGEDVCNLSEENETAEVTRDIDTDGNKTSVAQNRIMNWLTGVDEASQQYMRKQMAVLPEIDVNED